MNKKKLRNILLPIVIIAVIVACYVGYFMRTQPLLDCMTGTDIPSTGEITRYDEAHKDGVSLAVTSPDQVSGLWQAIQDTEVRFVRGRGTAVAPPGGVYYEVSLTSADGASVYGFGCNSNEDLVIQGSAYVIVGESQILQALDALFPCARCSAPSAVKTARCPHSAAGCAAPVRSSARKASDRGRSVPPPGLP